MHGTVRVVRIWTVVTGPGACVVTTPNAEPVEDAPALMVSETVMVDAAVMIAGLVLT